MMSGKCSRAWRSRHRGHSSSSDDDPMAEEVATKPGADWADVLSWNGSGWMLSMLMTLSTTAPGCKGCDWH